jgi:Putative beta barrel porin-7 (BBP7)
VEYLMWRTLHAPLGYPMATASLVNVGTGAVNSSGAVTFFDKGNMSYPWYSGVRGTVGMWLDSAERWGIEASGFFVNTPGIHFSAIASSTQPSLSGPAGPQGPISLYMPFINSVSGAATAQVIGAQGFSTGFIDINSTSDLNGAEVNLVRNVYRGPDCYVELLTGYRYVDLKESLSLTADTNARGTGTPLTSPSQFLITDSFATRSQFNGPQMGGRVTWRRDCFRVTVSGKVAVGVTQESGTILGTTTFFSSSAPPVTTTGGFYAQPSNIGSYTRSQFAAVPQLDINLGYQAGKHCFFYFGYNMLYWTRVVRPGDMVSPLLNPASIASNPSFTGAASTNPAPLFLSRDFWAQGVDMGLEVKY